MRIASFNVENLFSRARVMNQDEWSDGKEILKEFSRFTNLIENDVYTAATKNAIIASLTNLGLASSDENKYVILRQNHGRLLKRGAGGLEVIANGRSDWIGWLELKKEAVNETATQMTGKVIQDVNADILAVIEAEDRIALTRFNDQLLKHIGSAYGSIMLIDGNDSRGIDVGLLTKSGFPIESIVSHVDDRDGTERIFSRDCAEFQVRINSTTTILVMINHLKSKGYGPPAQSNARRKSQARRIREIYDLRRSEGIELIAILGDFNDTPTSDPLSPLLASGSDLADVATHPLFVSDGRPGTYANGTASNKIDYLLLSPELFTKVTSAGVNRMGVWGGVHGTLFPHYPEMTRSIHAASDHAAIWADISI